MFGALIGAVVGFILLAAGLSWIIIRTKGNFSIKVVAISIFIYYGFALFYAVPNIMGWAFNSDLPPDAKIISVRIVEPNNETDGGMWFWLNEKPDLKGDLHNLLDPRKLFIYTGAIQPRAYKISYDKELHRKLIEQKKRQKRNPGSSLLVGKKGIKKDRTGIQQNNQQYDDNAFRILNPREVMAKADEEDEDRIEIQE